MLPVLLGGLVWAAVLGGMVPGMFAGLDYPRIVEPYGEFFRASLLRGELPWWNPQASLGRPFLADLQAMAFYPATWLLLPLGVKGGWLAGTALHGALALWGFMRLGRTHGVCGPRAFAGGLLYLFSAPLFARMMAGQLGYVFSLCYLPLVLDLALGFARQPARRRWAALAVTWALQLLSCHPQVFWLSTLAAGLFVTGWLAQPPWRDAWGRWWRAAAGLATAAGAAVALLGFVLVPFLQLAGQSNRAEPSLAFSAAFGMDGRHWLSLLAPPRGDFAVNWEYDLHAGLVVLLGGALAWGRWRDPLARAALVLAAGGALIAAGGSTPVFSLLYKVVPGLENFRVPARAGVLLTLGLVLGTVSLLANPPRGLSWRIVLAGLAGVVAAGLLVFRGGAFPAVELGLLGLAAAGWLYWLSSGGSGRAAWLLGPGALLGAGLVVQGLNRLPAYATDFPAEALVRRIIADHPAEVAPVRVAVPPTLLRENSGMIHGYATPVGFESLSLARTWTYLHRAAHVDPGHAYNTSPSGAVYPAMPGFGSLNLRLMLPGADGVLRRVAQPDPRAYLVTQFQTRPGWPEAVTAAAAGHPIHQVALVEAGFADRLPAASGAMPGVARITRFALNSIEVEVDSPAPALLVLAEAWYPGWHAEVGGRETACLPANGWMRAAVVPAGRNQVRFFYRQEGLSEGGLLSLAAVLLLAGLCRPRRAAA